MRAGIFLSLSFCLNWEQYCSWPLFLVWTVLASVNFVPQMTRVVLCPANSAR